MIYCDFVARRLNSKHHLRDFNVRFRNKGSFVEVLQPHAQHRATKITPCVSNIFASFAQRSTYLNLGLGHQNTPIGSDRSNFENLQVVCPTIPGTCHQAFPARLSHLHSYHARSSSWQNQLILAAVLCESARRQIYLKIIIINCITAVAQHGKLRLRIFTRFYPQQK